MSLQQESKAIGATLYLCYIRIYVISKTVIRGEHCINKFWEEMDLHILLVALERQRELSKGNISVQILTYYISWLPPYTMYTTSCTIACVQCTIKIHTSFPTVNWQCKNNKSTHILQVRCRMFRLSWFSHIQVILHFSYQIFFNEQYLIGCVQGTYKIIHV